jgi:hypothetical protein
MATAFDNTKYDVQINDVPYRIRGYQRSELSTFIPRFGSGDQKESEFDLLRSKTISFDGGALQRTHTEDGMAYAIEGVAHKYFDGVLYPSIALSRETPPVIGGASKGKLTCISPENNAMTAWKVYNSTVTVAILNESSNLASSLTSSLGTVGAVTAIVFWQGYYFAFNGTSTIYRFTSTLTKVNVTGSSVAITQAVNFNEILYGTDGFKLYRYSGTISTSAWEEVASLPYPQGLTGTTQRTMFIYNNRIMILTSEGMYAYDGIQLVTIENNRGESTIGNYRCPAVLRGYLYYIMADGFYRFNGSLIEKMYDITEIGNVVDMAVYRGRIWILIGNSSNEKSSRYDKSMGFDFTGTQNIAGSVFVFDGVSMLQYGRIPTLDNTSYTNDYLGQNQVDKIYPYYDSTLARLGVAVTMKDGQDFKMAITKNTNTQDETDIVTSIFDGEFPQINKELEQIELIFDGTVTADTFTLEYKTNGFDGSTSWTTIGTFSSTNADKLIVNDIPNGIVFKSIQVRVKGTITDDNYGIKQLILRYTLQPDYKSQWTMTMLCYGDDTYGKLQLADKTSDATAVDVLRGNIYESRESNLPLLYLDIDYLILDGSLNDSTTTVTVDSTDILKSNTGYIQIGTEVMRYTARTATTLTVVRGVLGSTAISHSDNAIVQVAYRVVVRSIQNERIELYDDEQSSVSLRNRDTEITLVLQEV